MKKQGRPRKKIPLNLNVIQPGVNNNANNIYPIRYAFKGKVEYIENMSHDLIFNSTHSDIFRTLCEIFKSKHEFMIWSIDDTGICIKQDLPVNYTREIFDIEAKLYSVNFSKFMVARKFEIKIGILHLFNIFKCIKKNTPFSFKVRRRSLDKNLTYNPYIIEVMIDKDRWYLELPDYNIKNQQHKVSADMEYPVVCMMDIGCFVKKCMDVKRVIAPIMKLMWTENNFLIKSDGDNIKNICVYEDSELFKIIKGHKYDKDIVANYNLIVFPKVNKTKDISNIVKIYLSNKNPLIIEYDINPGYGTLHLIIEEYDSYTE